MNELLSKRPARRFGAALPVVAVALFAVALAGCESSAPTPAPTSTEPVPSATATPGNFSNLSLDLEDMISDSSAIVVGTIIGELEPSLVSRQTSGSLGTEVIDRFRNLIVGVQESYVPGLQPGQTITVRVADGRHSVHGGADAAALQDLAGLGVDERALLFLYRMDRKTQQYEPYAPPEGAPADSYYGLMPTRTDNSEGNVTVGHLIPDGNGWLDLETGATVGQAELDELVAEHAHIVPPDCFTFLDYGDYAPVRSLYELVERSEVVIKGRIGPDLEFASSRGYSIDVDVLNVILGDVGTTPITVTNSWNGYSPGFESCEFYLFLNPYGGRLGSGPQSTYALSAGGTQGVFAVHAGLIEGLFAWSEMSRYRGMSEEEFVGEILEGAEWVERNDD